MAYNVGDRILYGAVGIMEIVDISEQTVAGMQKQYYILKELGSISDSHTYVPLDNARLMAAMHPLLSSEDIYALIERAPEISALEWVENNRARAEKYKEIMELGDRGAIIAMVKSISNMANERAAIGKKNYIADDTAKKRACHLLYSEVSLVLGIPESEAEALIKKQSWF